MLRLGGVGSTQQSKESGLGASKQQFTFSQKSQRAQTGRM